MIKKALMLASAILMVGCVVQPAVQAKSSAPVSFEYSVPAELSEGASVNTSIRVVARSDLQRLVVSAAAYSGISLIAGGDRQVIENIKQGESRQIDVSVLLHEPVGYLALFASTTDIRGHTEHKNVAIRYGDAAKVGQRRLNANARVEKSAGETLIIMPAQRR